MASKRRFVRNLPVVDRQPSAINRVLDRVKDWRSAGLILPPDTLNPERTPARIDHEGHAAFPRANRRSGIIARTFKFKIQTRSLSVRERERETERARPFPTFSLKTKVTGERIDSRDSSSPRWRSGATCRLSSQGQTKSSCFLERRRRRRGKEKKKEGRRSDRGGREREREGEGEGG